MRTFGAKPRQAATYVSIHAVGIIKKKKKKKRHTVYQQADEST